MIIAQYTQVQRQDVQPDRTFVYGNGITEVLAMFLYEKPYSQDDVDLLFGFFDCWLTYSGGNGYNDSYDYVDDGKIDLKDWAVLANHSWNLPDPASYETRYYYLTDALGSVRGLIGGKFNREEDREFYNYDVYGTSSDSSAIGNPFMFAGYWNDAESGFYFTKHRSYEPVTGRWLQFDPTGYADSKNLYEYVKSSPVMFIDPFGTSMTAYSFYSNLGPYSSSNTSYDNTEISGPFSAFNHFNRGGGTAAHYSKDMMDRFQKLIGVNNILNDFDSLLSYSAKYNARCGEKNSYSEHFEGRISNSLYPIGDPEEGAMALEDIALSTSVGGFDMQVQAKCSVNCNSRKEKLPVSNDNGCYCFCRFNCQIKVTVTDNYNFRGSNNIGLYPLELIGTDYDVSGSFTRSTAGSFYQRW